MTAGDLRQKGYAIEVLLDRGLERYRTGATTTALQLWGEALAIDPDEPRALTYIDYVRQNWDEVDGCVDPPVPDVSDLVPNYLVERPPPPVGNVQAPVAGQVDSQELEARRAEATQLDARIAAARAEIARLEAVPDRVEDAATPRGTTDFKLGGVGGDGWGLAPEMLARTARVPGVSRPWQMATDGEPESPAAASPNPDVGQPLETMAAHPKPTAADLAPAGSPLSPDDARTDPRMRVPTDDELDAMSEEATGMYPRALAAAALASELDDQVAVAVAVSRTVTPVMPSRAPTPMLHGRSSIGGPELLKPVDDADFDRDLEEALGAASGEAGAPPAGPGEGAIAPASAEVLEAVPVAVGDEDFDEDLDLELPPPVGDAPLDALMLAALVEPPAGAVAEVPAGAVAEVPTDAVEEVPTDAVEEVPTDAVEEVPTDAVEEVPTDAVEEVPTDAVEEVPPDAVEEVSAAAADVIEEVSADVVEEVLPDGAEELGAPGRPTDAVATDERVAAAELAESPATSSGPPADNDPFGDEKPTVWSPMSPARMMTLAERVEQALAREHDPFADDGVTTSWQAPPSSLVEATRGVEHPSLPTAAWAGGRALGDASPSDPASELAAELMGDDLSKPAPARATDATALVAPGTELPDQLERLHASVPPPAPLDGDASIFDRVTTLLRIERDEPVAPDAVDTAPPTPDSTPSGLLTLDPTFDIELAPRSGVVPGAGSQVPGGGEPPLSTDDVGPLERASGRPPAVPRPVAERARPLIAADERSVEDADILAADGDDEVAMRSRTQTPRLAQPRRARTEPPPPVARTSTTHGVPPMSRTTTPTGLPSVARTATPTLDSPPTTLRVATLPLPLLAPSAEDEAALAAARTATRDLAAPPGAAADGPQPVEIALAPAEARPSASADGAPPALPSSEVRLTALSPSERADRVSFDGAEAQTVTITPESIDLASPEAGGGAHAEDGDGEDPFELPTAPITPLPEPASIAAPPLAPWPVAPTMSLDASLDPAGDALFETSSDASIAELDAAATAARAEPADEPAAEGPRAKTLELALPNAGPLTPPPTDENAYQVDTADLTPRIPAPPNDVAAAVAIATPGVPTRDVETVDLGVPVPGWNGEPEVAPFGRRLEAAPAWQPPPLAPAPAWQPVEQRGATGRPASDDDVHGEDTDERLGARLSPAVLRGLGLTPMLDGATTDEPTRNGWPTGRRPATPVGSERRDLDAGPPALEDLALPASQLDHLAMDDLELPAPRAVSGTRTPGEVLLRSSAPEALAAALASELDRGAPTGESPDDRARRRITALLERASAAARAGEHPMSIAAIDLALSEAPDSAVAQKLVHRSRDIILDCYQRYFGDLARRPVPVGSLTDLTGRALDPRAAFLVSRMDGNLTYEEILDVAGMGRLEACRHLAQLLVRGIIRAS